MHKLETLVGEIIFLETVLKDLETSLTHLERRIKHLETFLCEDEKEFLQRMREERNVH